MKLHLLKYLCIFVYLICSQSFAQVSSRVDEASLAFEQMQLALQEFENSPTTVCEDNEAVREIQKQRQKLLQIFDRRTFFGKHKGLSENISKISDVLNETDLQLQTPHHVSKFQYQKLMRKLKSTYALAVTSQEKLAEAAELLTQLYARLIFLEGQSSFDLDLERKFFIIALKAWVHENSQLQSAIAQMIKWDPSLRLQKRPNSRLDQSRSTEGNLLMLDPTSSTAQAYQWLNSWCVNARPLLPDLLRKLDATRPLSIQALQLESALSDNFSPKFIYRDLQDGGPLKSGWEP